MKQIVFIFFFISFFGIQTVQAQFMNLGLPEIFILLLIGFFTIAFIFGFVFFVLHLIKRPKHIKNEK